MTTDDASRNMVKTTSPVKPDMVEFSSIAFAYATRLDRLAPSPVTSDTTADLLRCVLIRGFFLVVTVFSYHVLFCLLGPRHLLLS